uniref:Thioredoxin domain-containing protein 12 n=1 Tax=Globodera rostochiensis TaxID=31243 RepID=A0A914I6F6_GLORO
MLRGERLLINHTKSTLLFCRRQQTAINTTEKTNKIEPERPNNEAETDEFKDPSGGFGMDIDWVPWPQAVSVALDLNRPIFLLVHKSWCGACQALKKSFSTSSKRKELLELSNKFVMSNTNDEDETEDEEYAPDGRYIPRLFILDKYGKRYPVDNKKNFPSNIAYFPQVPDVIRAMKMGLELFEKEQSGEKTEEGESDQKKEKEGGKGGGKE